MAFHNRVKFSTSTTGTGSVTVGSASSGFQTPASAGMADGESSQYVIEDGTDWETGTTTKSGSTMTRVLEQSSTAALLNLTGSAVMYLVPTAKTMNVIASAAVSRQVGIGSFSM